MNELINHEGDCRTSLAIPGLLNATANDCFIISRGTSHPNGMINDHLNFPF